MPTQLPENWLRGPVPNIPALLQPVAHALLQVMEELKEELNGFDDAKLWLRPVGKASVGFHLKHMRGVMDRLCSYARGEALTEAQLTFLRQEAEDTGHDNSAQILLTALQQQTEMVLGFLATLNPDRITDYRAVGRQQLPSTQLGLLFHLAEHSMRHLGQLIVTVAVLKHSAND